jgi:formamidopyrimidine-DNA glycosylase
MPELPEVETITRELNGRLPGRRIVNVTVFREDPLLGVSPASFRRALVGRTIEGCSRRGKFLIFRLSPSGHLVAHLRMTGKFALSAPLPSPLRYHRAWFTLDGGDVLVYQDLRCLGTLEVVDDLADSDSLSKLGVDPLSRGFSEAWLRVSLAESRTPIKHWLMDQTKVAGLGNIYVSEILFASGLSPQMPANRLRRDQIERLHRAIRRILRLAIRKNGTTIRDFRRVDEHTGEFQDFLKVYGKAGDPCPRCGTAIARMVQQQRSTFYCPRCQGTGRRRAA